MDTKDIQDRLSFLRAAEGLKCVLRSAKLSDGVDENTAAHSWRLALWVVTFRDQMEGLDLTRMLEMAVVHDLGETISGDIPAILQVDAAVKERQERTDLETLLRPLPEGMRAHFWSLWEEYEAGETEEAQWVKALDKLETMLQHNQGDNDPDFDYRFNLSYGVAATSKVELLAFVRTFIDTETASNAEHFQGKS
ncbi:MAG: HD domain-containing protein [Pseudomonadota bacterium]